MPWYNRFISHPFTYASVVSNAPSASGVYALYVPTGPWVYIGESNDIQRRLLEHLKESGTCLANYRGLYFSYELAPTGSRVTRQNQLILELRPVCNQRLG